MLTAAWVYFGRYTYSVSTKANESVDVEWIWILYMVMSYKNILRVPLPSLSSSPGAIRDQRVEKASTSVAQFPFKIAPSADIVFFEGVWATEPVLKFIKLLHCFILFCQLPICTIHNILLMLKILRTCKNICMQYIHTKYFNFDSYKRFIFNLVSIFLSFRWLYVCTLYIQYNKIPGY